MNLLWPFTAFFLTIGLSCSPRQESQKKSLESKNPTPNEENSNLQASRLFTEGCVMKDSGNYRAALRMLQRADSLLSLKPVKSHYPIAEILHEQAACLNELGNSEEALNLYRTASKNYLKSVNEGDKRLAEVWYGMASIFLYSNGDSLNYYCDKVIRVLGEKHEISARCIVLKGFLYLFRNELESAMPIMTKGMNLQISLVGPDHFDLADTYQLMGILYKRTGDMDQSEHFTGMALRIFSKNLNTNHPKLGPVYNDLGIMAKNKADYERAVYYLEFAEKILKKNFGSRDLRLGSIYNNLGVSYFNQGKHRDALVYFQKTTSIRKEQVGENDPSLALPYRNIGTCYTQIGMPDSALMYFQKGLNLVRFDQSTWIKPSLYFVIGNYYATWDFQKASQYFDSSLVSLRYKPGKVLFGHEERSDAFMASFMKGWVKLRIFQRQNKAKTLEEAKDNFVLALDLFQQIQEKLTKKESKQYFSNIHFKAFEGAIETQLEYYKLTGKREHLHKAFEISEKSKGLLLLEAMRKTSATIFAGVPDSIIQQENSFLENIARLEQEMNSLDLTQPSDKFYEIDGHLFRKKEGWKHFMDSLNLFYPDYHRMKYDTRVVTVKETQEKILEPDQAVVEYVAGDLSLFVFVLTKDTFFTHTIPLDFPLQEWVQHFRTGLYGHFLSQKTQEKLSLSKTDSLLSTYGFRLYEKIIAPIGPLPDNLVIVPDGTLGYLPFEALLSAKPVEIHDYTSYPFLFRQKRISYNYSSTLWKEMRDRSYTSTGCLAVAPTYNACKEKYADQAAFRSDLCQLQHNKTEARIVGKLLDGKTLLGKDAKLTSFQKLAPGFCYLHLSQHAVLNDDNPDYSYLAFTEMPGEKDKSQLYIRDIYALHLPSEMVFLSACETGLGQLRRGEGILSLARGFSYAGAKSIFTTLWKVNDKASYELAKCFYGNLKLGMEKDLAMQQAKETYFKTHKGLEAHPFFWAGIIGIGDMRKISVTGSQIMHWWVWGVLIVVLAIAGILLWHFGLKNKLSPVTRQLRQ